MKYMKKIFVVLAVSMLMFSMVLTTYYGVYVQNKEKKIQESLLNPNPKLLAMKSHGMGMVGK